MTRLLVHAPYYRPHVGGVETYVEELHEALWASGDVEAVTVLAPAIPADAPADERQPDGTRVLRYPALDLIPNFPVPRFWSPGWRRAIRAAGATRPDVVVGHTRFFVSSAVALAHARVLRARHVHVEHGSDYVQMDSRWTSAAARTYDHLIGRAVLRRADARIAVSAAAAAFVRRLAGVDAAVVHRGLPLGRLNAVPPAAAAERLAAGRPLIAFVGRLIDGKGVGDLIDAVAELDEDAACVIVGDGPRRTDLEARAARRHGERFAFLGYLPEDEALGWIRAADVVVNPSYTEGLPTTVLWAAALGRGVVATDVGGTAEIVADGVTGLLVPPRDVPALRDALARLVREPAEREAMAARAREDSRARFDTDHGARRWLAAATGAEPAGAGLPHSGRVRSDRHPPAGR